MDPWQAHPEVEAQADSALQFLDSLSLLSFDFSELTASGSIYRDIAVAMRNNPGTYFVRLQKPLVSPR